MKVSVDEVNKVEALYHSKSLIEQARALRDEDWNSISSLTFGIDYYFEKSATFPEKWVATSGVATVDGYTMKIIFTQVNRDANDDIAQIGSVDADTIKATSTVSYQTRSGIKQVDLFEYLTNYN